MNYFSIELSHVMKSGFYTTGNSRLSGWTEKELQSTSQRQTCFLNFSETITSEKSISEMHQKLQHLQPALVNRKGPICLHNTTQLYVAQPLLQKLKETGNEILPHLPYSLDLLPTNYHFFKHLNNFLQGKSFHNQQDTENAFQEFVESWGMNIYATGINLFLTGKNASIIMVPILTNKDVFEPSYNDLKFSLKPQICLHQPNSWFFRWWILSFQTARKKTGIYLWALEIIVYVRFPEILLKNCNYQPHKNNTEQYLINPQNTVAPQQ